MRVGFLGVAVTKQSVTSKPSNARSPRGRGYRGTKDTKNVQSPREMEKPRQQIKLCLKHQQVQDKKSFAKYHYGRPQQSTWKQTAIFLALPPQLGRQIYVLCFKFWYTPKWMRKNKLHDTFLKEKVSETRCKPDCSASTMHILSISEEIYETLWPLLWHCYKDGVNEKCNKMQSHSLVDQRNPAWLSLHRCDIPISLNKKRKHILSFWT